MNNLEQAIEKAYVRINEMYNDPKSRSYINNLIKSFLSHNTPMRHSIGKYCGITDKKPVTVNQLRHVDTQIVNKLSNFLLQTKPTKDIVLLSFLKENNKWEDFDTTYTTSLYSSINSTKTLSRAALFALRKFNEYLIEQKEQREQEKFTTVEVVNVFEIAEIAKVKKPRVKKTTVKE